MKSTGFFLLLDWSGLPRYEGEVLDFLMEDFLSILSLGETGSSDISVVTANLILYLKSKLV